MARALTEEQIGMSKDKQMVIINECDAAISDLQYNIGVLNVRIAEENTKKKMAEDTLSDLEKDFPAVIAAATVVGERIYGR